MRHRLVTYSAGVLFLSMIAMQKLVSQQPAPHAPSAHCHSTDGTFTTCPNGSQEWSDVQAIAFPDTKSFLYADQARLNVSSASQAPDTLMLLYDECSRTTPLGPNEYVLVTSRAWRRIPAWNGYETMPSTFLPTVLLCSWKMGYCRRRAGPSQSMAKREK